MVRFSLLALLVIACSTAAPAGPGEPTPTGGAESADPAHSPAPDQSPAPVASPSPGDPLAGLIGDLAAAGLSASEGDPFDAMPLANQGRRVCADGESISVYVFASPEEARARAAMIDPQDPSNVGTAIIEWAGNPKFWLHDRVLVLYLGTDAEVIDKLVTALGEPFAFGRGRPALRGDDVC